LTTGKKRGEMKILHVSEGVVERQKRAVEAPSITLVDAQHRPLTGFGRISGVSSRRIDRR
jgi:hypothetical protein